MYGTDLVDLWPIQYEFNFRKLAENKLLKVGGVFEDGLLFNKRSRKVTHLGWFYGDPCCGLVDKNGNWAIIGSKAVRIWAHDEVKDLNIDWAFDMRLNTDGLVEILTDPWSPDSSVWRLDPRTFEHEKIRPFQDYIGKAYTDEVRW